MEITRDVQDLDDDQLQEVLEAHQIETARSKGEVPPHWSPQSSLRVPGVVVKMTWMTGKWASEGRGDGDIVSPSSSPQVPLWLMQMLATSSACLQLGWGSASPVLTPLVWGHSWKDLGVFWAVVPQGPVYQGPLPRGSGLEDYHLAMKGGSGGYSQVHGTHC